MAKGPQNARKASPPVNLRETVIRIQHKAAELLAKVERTHAKADQVHREAEQSHLRAEKLHQDVRDKRARNRASRH